MTGHTLEKRRCFGDGDPLYERYHDEEWGRPPRLSEDERELFERIALEGFQSGLSWLTVLRKRPAFRSAFDDFAPDIVAGYGEEDVERLLQDAGIIRNRQKIEATIANARALVALHDDGGSLMEVIERHAPAEHVAPATTDDRVGTSAESKALAKELKGLGFRFVGPTTMYALMQAIGVIDDHAEDCWLKDADALPPCNAALAH